MHEKNRSISRRINIFNLIADAGQVLLESVLRDHYRSATVVGVERERGSLLQTAIEKEDDMMVGIVDESERTDASGFKSQVSHHPFGRSEREFAGRLEALRNKHVLEPMLDVVNRQVIIAREAYQVMLIALMIAHEDILTMHTPVVMPPAFGFLYGFAFGVIVSCERNVMFVQIAQHFLLPIGYNIVVIHSVKKIILLYAL